jgi:hypothetical protein
VSSGIVYSTPLPILKTLSARLRRESGSTRLARATSESRSRARHTVGRAAEAAPKKRNERSDFRP